MELFCEMKKIIADENTEYDFWASDTHLKIFGAKATVNGEKYSERIRLGRKPILSLQFKDLKKIASGPMKDFELKYL